MFQTPPKSRAMVNTRRTAKKNKELYGEMSKAADDMETAVQDDSRQPNTTSDHDKQEKDPKQVEQSGKVKPSSKIGLPSKSEKISKSISRSKSASSSVLARRKRLELEAAEAKAKIQMEIIDKRLAADLAELEENVEYSSQSEGREEGDHTKVEVEKWLERSHRELEEEAAQPQDTNLGDLQLPPPAQQTAAQGGTNGTIHMLASALKDLAAATTANGSHAQMLSRLSTPKDLPGFGGDPLDWLQFKQAYEDSTKVCNFSNQENLWRLRKCLHGAAKNAVTALLISATSPDVVMSTLELQFGNPDIIIAKIVYEINKLQPMAQEYHKEIVTFSVKVKNYVAAVLAIGQDEYLKGTNVISIILSKLPTVLISKWADYSYPIISSGDKPKLVILSEFLNQEAIKISKTSVNLIYNPSDYKRKQSDNVNRTHTVLVQNSSDSNIASDDKCRFCKINKHKIIDCKKFKKALRKDRWQFIKRNGLCYKCLVSRHNRDACSAPVCDKDNCGQSHHQLLHFSDVRGDEQCQPPVAPTPAAPAAASTSASELPSEAVAHVNDNSYSQVLLKTVPINIHGPYGTVSTVALLDDGSTVTIVSDELMVKLGIRGRKQTLKVRSAWDGSELMCDSEVVDLSVSNSDGTMFKLQARTTKRLNLPTQFISLDKLKCSEAINNIKHKLCFGQCKPEILIGQDNYYLLLPLEVIRDNPTEPYLTRTPLGWCLHGRTYLNMNCRSTHSTLFLSENDETDDLHEEVRRSFSIEGISRKPRCYQASVRKNETVIVAPNVPDSESSPAHAQRQPISTKTNESRALASATRLSYTNLQLHIFSDSSTYAMAAVAFWRWQDNDAQTKLAFISSKCRVAPLKHTSVPRLELQPALLAARLADTITKEHRNMLPIERYFWCDLSTVLYWIRNNARDYKAFVAHRIGEIDEFTQIKVWYFIPTKMNIADIATKDTCELDMLQNEWLYGPEFLYKGKETWPADVQPEVSTDVLERVSLVVTEKYSPAVPEPERFSSWLRLLKSTCMVLLFIDKRKKLTSAIDGDMMWRAERLLIMQKFAEDLEHLKQKETLNRKSKLLTLTPVTDEYGVLRVGSRIDQAPGIPPETKYPVILDGRNYVAQLMVKHHHVKAAHGSQEVLVNNNLKPRLVCCVGQPHAPLESRRKMSADALGWGMLTVETYMSHVLTYFWLCCYFVPLLFTNKPMKMERSRSLWVCGG